MTDVGDHDLQLWVPQRDLVDQDRPCLEQRAGAGKGCSLMDQHREPESLERLADAEEVGAERVDVLVDRAELAADETEVALHPLELVDRRAGGRVDCSEADQPGRIAGNVRRDVVIGNDETGRRGVEAQDDRSIDVYERVRVVVVQAPAQRYLGPGCACLGRELLADVQRVLADMGMDVGDHAGVQPSSAHSQRSSSAAKTGSVTAISPKRRAVRRTAGSVASISMIVASNGGSIMAPTMSWSSGPALVEHRA